MAADGGKLLSKIRQLSSRSRDLQDDSQEIPGKHRMPKILGKIVNELLDFHKSCVRFSSILFRNSQILQFFTVNRMYFLVIMLNELLYYSLYGRFLKF